MNCGKTAAVIIFLLLIASSASAQQDGLKLLDGTWVSQNRGGPHVIFNRGSGGVRHASLPNLGLATIRPSNGEEGSNLKVSGPGFDCYYLFSKIGPREMIWDLKSGSTVCPQSDHFKKATP